MIMMLALMIHAMHILDALILLRKIPTKINVSFSTAIKKKVFGILI
jgi:hypothetical protein